MRVKSFTFEPTTEANDWHFEGWASTYTQDREGDTMIKGCFDESVENQNTLPLLFNHSTNTVIGKLELSVKENGLWAKGTFNLNDPRASNTYDLVKMRALTAMSIGFIVKDYEPKEKHRPFGGWNIKKAEVVETSIVTVPANSEALIENVKSMMAGSEKEESQKLYKMVCEAVEKSVSRAFEKRALLDKLSKLKENIL